MNDPVPVVALVGCLVLAWTAAWVDVRTFKIPNALTLAGAGCGLAAQVAVNGLDGLWTGLAGLGLGLALLFPGYLFKVTGAGDVKLMGAVGAFLGPERVLLVLLFTILAGGLMGAVYAVAAWRTEGARGPFRRYGSMLRFFWVTGRPSYVPPARDEAMGQRLPFAVPIAVGATVAALWPL
jgi:prepilin peptidase CpaA